MSSPDKGVARGEVEALDSEASRASVKVDPELDTAAEDAVAGDDATEQDVAEHDQDDSTPGSPKGSGRRTAAIVVGVGLSLAVAVGVVLGANVLTARGSGVDRQVSDPAVVVAALSDAGFDCRTSAVSGDIATCGSTIAVRVFPSETAAKAWVIEALSDPSSTSASGWVGRGNVVVAAPVALTPEIATTLGEGARKY